VKTTPLSRFCPRSALYALAIVVEAVRSRAWIAAFLFALVAGAAVWVAGRRARFRLGRDELEVRIQFRGHVTRLPTLDVLDFVAASGLVRVLKRDGAFVDLPRGTIRSHDEARALAAFLRDHLADLREREAGYRSF
jgi:hypothetical protein